MKFDAIRLTGASVIDLPLIGVDASGPFVLKGADGLGPTEINVRMTDTTQEGAVYQGRRPRNREIVLRVGLQPDWDIGQTASELRTVLYDLLTPKSNDMILVDLMLNGAPVARAWAQVSTLETAIFTQDPEVQITLPCDYPYFLAINPVEQIPTRVTGTTDTVATVQNVGTAPSGFWMGLTLQENKTGDFIVTTGDGSQKVTIKNISWAAGDRFIIDTRPGQRNVWRSYVDGAGNRQTVSILANLTADSDWLYLHRGTNNINLNITAFDWYLSGVMHTPAYWGV